MESICVPLSWPPLVESTGDVRAEFEFVGLSGIMRTLLLGGGTLLKETTLLGVGV